LEQKRLKYQELVRKQQEAQDEINRMQLEQGADLALADVQTVAKDMVMVPRGGAILLYPPAKDGMRTIKTIQADESGADFLHFKQAMERGENETTYYEYGGRFTINKQGIPEFHRKNTKINLSPGQKTPQDGSRGPVAGVGEPIEQPLTQHELDAIWTTLDSIIGRCPGVVDLDTTRNAFLQVAERINAEYR
jgi:hypothetical protein